MAEIDWNAEARLAANHVSDNQFEEHRGAKSWGTLGMSVVFGSDGYDTDDMTKRDVELVRACLRSVGIVEIGFGVSGDGYTWALLARTERHEELNNLVWVAWNHARADDHVAAIPDAALWRTSSPALLSGSRWTSGYLVASNSRLLKRRSAAPAHRCNRRPTDKPREVGLRESRSDSTRILR